MKGSTHLAGGLLAGALLAQSASFPIGLVVAGVSALAPDWFQINAPGANQVVKGVMGHRGLSHWLLAAMLVGLGAGRAITPELTLFVLAGWSSHIVLDLFSGGVPALFPLPRITLANIKTASQLDTIIGAACLVLASAIFIWRLL